MLDVSLKRNFHTFFFILTFIVNSLGDTVGLLLSYFLLLLILMIQCPPFSSFSPVQMSHPSLIKSYTPFSSFFFLTSKASSRWPYLCISNTVKTTWSGQIHDHQPGLDPQHFWEIDSFSFINTLSPCSHHLFQMSSTYFKSSHFFLYFRLTRKFLILPHYNHPKCCNIIVITVLNATIFIYFNGIKSKS